MFHRFNCSREILLTCHSKISHFGEVCGYVLINYLISECRILSVFSKKKNIYLNSFYSKCGRMRHSGNTRRHDIIVGIWLILGVQIEWRLSRQSQRKSARFAHELDEALTARFDYTRAPRFTRLAKLTVLCIRRFACVLKYTLFAHRYTSIVLSVPRQTLTPLCFGM